VGSRLAVVKTSAMDRTSICRYVTRCSSRLLIALHLHTKCSQVQHFTEANEDSKDPANQLLLSSKQSPMVYFSEIRPNIENFMVLNHWLITI